MLTTAEAERAFSADKAYSAFETAATVGSLAGPLRCADELLVSSNVIRDRSSCGFDSRLTQGTDRFVEVIGEYDCDRGYTCRLVGLTTVNVPARGRNRSRRDSGLMNHPRRPGRRAERPMWEASMANAANRDEDIAYTADVSSSVIFVTDLDRSVEFYSEVFGCTASLHETSAALLLTISGFQIYLVAKGPREPHPTGGIGDRHLIWAAESRDGLAHFEDALRSRDAYTDTHTNVGGVTFVEGRDPDGIRVMIAHPDPTQRPRSVVDGRLYN